MTHVASKDSQPKKLLAEIDVTLHDGWIDLDQEKIEAREDAQVRNVIFRGNLPLVVLGGTHNLTDNVGRLDGDFELIVVTTGRVEELLDTEHVEGRNQHHETDLDH